jgi:hypothetical protein
MNTTMDERYIGLAIAISGSFAIGTSIILTKKVRQPPCDSCAQTDLNPT